MTSQPKDNPQESIGVQIANQIIDFANKQMEQGIPTAQVASGLRHAAANFTAFEFFQTVADTKDPNVPVDEFISFFEHYLSVHKPKEPTTPGILNLVEQAKNEVSK